MKPFPSRVFRPLFIVCALLFTVWALKPSASSTEAWWLWVVRDVVDVQPAAPSDVLRGARDNVSSAIDRSEGGLHAPLAVVLEGWTWLAGDSLEAFRWGAVLLVMLAGAFVVRFGGRAAPQTTWRALGVLAVILPALAVVQPSDVIAQRLQDLRARRTTPAEMVITTFSESSVLGYYQHRYNIRAGMGLDLGWREFSPQEIIDIADNLDATRSVWLVSPRHDHPIALTLVGHLTETTQGRHIHYTYAHDGGLTVIGIGAAAQK